MFVVVAGCAAADQPYSLATVQFAAADFTKGESPPDKSRKRKPIKPKPQPKPAPKSPLPEAQRGPVGSGDAIPVASYHRHDGEVMGAVAPSAQIVVGASAGDAVGGLLGAVWVDNNKDGYVDGYVYNGQYYSGAPAGYDPDTHTVLTAHANGALGGVASGATASQILTGSVFPLDAVIGAAVEGLPGAIWADRNNDGVVDGYVYNGQYYFGAPTRQLPLTKPVPKSPIDHGERGE